jgi:uncharacterized membrane protein YdjX (TVP38/TMEM64 family)
MAIALAAHAAGFGTEAFRVRLAAAIADLGPWAPLAFVAAKICTVVLALPSAPVSLAGGALFGPVLGTALNWSAALTGSVATFFLGRALGRGEVEARLGGRLRDLDARLAEDGLRVTLFLRLVPLFPFNAINYGAGLTRLRFRDYFWGTALGILPGAVVFTWLGHSANQGSTAGVAVGLGVLGVLVLLPALWRRPGRSMR